jgi:branched-chain amino acid transport system substrate-binding protein
MRTPSRRRRQTAPVMGVVVLALVASGCGTRLSGAERAAARAGGSTTTVLTGQPGTGTSELPGATTTGSVAGGTTGVVTGSSTGSSGSGTSGTSGAGGSGTTGTVSGTGATGTTGGVGGSATGQAAAPKGSTLLIGSVGTFSGPGGAAWAPGTEGLQLWVKDVNQRGGVEGHPVKLLVADDGNDPARHLSIVKDMVENKGVFALLYDVASTTYSKALDDYLKQKGVPAIGGDSGSAFWEKSNMFFPLGTTQSAAFFSHMKAAKLAHPDITKIGVLTCREADGCNEATTGWPAAGKRVGFTTVYNGQVSIAQPDFTAECLNARNAGADILFVAVDPNSVRRLARACATQSYKPVYVLPSGVISSAQAGDPNLEGTIGVNLVMPWMSAASPGQQELQRAVKRYNPNLKLNITTPFGWVAGKMLEKAAAGRLGSTPSRAAVVAGLYAFKGETLGGIAPPLTFSRSGKKADCWFTLSFKGGSWKEGNGGRASCP